MPTPKPEIHQVEPTKLKLDPQNPRLSAEEEGSSQPKLLRIMIERFKLEELAESILASGYLPFDPLIGYKDGEDTIVLEGNRRVAALQLLLNPSLAPERFRSRWQQLHERADDEVKGSIEQIEIQLFEDRAAVDVRSYIGFRHVTGVLQWPALEKASFIADLVEAEWNYKQIADRLGSYSKHVERHYVGYRIVQQAIDSEIPGSSRLQGSFGVLMRALQNPEIREFIGVDFPGDPEASRRPVPENKQDNFARFIAWSFGSDDQERLLKDSRHLTQWGKILASAEAVSYLRRTPSPSFERAWFRSGGERESLLDSLLTAADHLEESIPLIPLHKEQDDVMSAVKRCAQFVAQALRDFPDLREEFCPEEQRTD